MHVLLPRQTVHTQLELGRRTFPVAGADLFGTIYLHTLPPHRLCLLTLINVVLYFSHAYDDRDLLCMAVSSLCSP